MLCCCLYRTPITLVEGVTKIGVEKFEAMDVEEDDELQSATGPQRCK